MSTRVKLQMDPVQKILTKRNLNRNGAGQRFLTGEVRRLCDPYVPLLNGPLKNTAVEDVDRITYIQPYAQKQYHENPGNGLRGKYWDKRMMADRGGELVRSVADFCGGKAK